MTFMGVLNYFINEKGDETKTNVMCSSLAEPEKIVEISNKRIV